MNKHSEPKTTYRAKAPLRIGFAGGGTDVPPYVDTYGGVVFNGAIKRYAHVSWKPNGSGEIQVISLDYDYEVAYSLDDNLVYDGNLDLVKGVINYFKDRLNGGRLIFWCDAPPGSGLGSSSTIVVALLGALHEQLGMTIEPYKIAELAIQIERNEIGITGGRQDQYAAAFGGVNLIEFQLQKTIVNPLRLPQRIINELEYALLIGYTGRSRYSGKIIESQQKNVRKADQSATEAMHRQKQHAVGMKEALLVGDIPSFGLILREAWKEKKKFSTRISNLHIDQLMKRVLDAGAWGGKISGAGGGGFVFFVVPFEKRRSVAATMRKHNVQLIDFQLEMVGLQTWRVHE
jgi:D-glycero-alpha-D-manno-heptose-7-phosphate kinase